MLIGALIKQIARVVVIILGVISLLKWGKLTDDDLNVIEGRRDQLEGKLQQLQAGFCAGSQRLFVRPA